MARVHRITRRRTMKVAAGAIGAALPLVYVQSAAAAGKLTLGVWDHWVPAANPVLKGLIDEWAAKNKVEVSIDFITSIGNKITLTLGAEAQARSGHDIMAFDQYACHQYADRLMPVNDVVDGLVKQYGPVSKAVEYLGTSGGKWLAVGDAADRRQGRRAMLKEFCGEDVTEWYPAKDVKTKGAADWTYEKQLKMAEQVHKAGKLFALGCGASSTDANQTWGATFGAFGAELVDRKGNVVVDSDAVREVLDYVKRFVAYLPRETASYDDASNNKAYLAGAAALIWNPPSAWAVAKRDAPAIAADTWHFPSPKGKMGRLVPHRPYYWGVWEWSQNKPAAKDLLAFVNQREVVNKLSLPAAGYDIPPFLSMSDLPVWADTEPPKGTIYNYPLRPHHDAEYYIVGSSAPPDIGVQIWSQNMIPGMAARIVSGQTPKQVIDWAKSELEGIRR